MGDLFPLGDWFPLLVGGVTILCILVVMVIVLSIAAYHFRRVKSDREILGDK